jgi:hypothetical protein
VLVFSSPQILASIHLPVPSYPILTGLFAALLVACVIPWRWQDTATDDGDSPWTAAAAILGIAAAIIVAIAMYRWTRTVVWQRTRADMLIVIREATRRFLNGKNPYTTYRTYDAPWTMAFPYGPGLWGPYLVLQLLRVDFRMLTIAGQLFVPVWCGIAAVAESRRGRVGHAVVWLGMLVSLVLAFDGSGFALLGHTAVYWPLLPVLAVTVVRRHWIAAAVALGALVVARTTMVALVPVLLMTVWREDRRRFPHATAALAATVVVALLPFIVWDAHAIWDGMVRSYPRVVKIAVWASDRRAAINTLGFTGWLLGRHLDAFVEPAQLVVMIATYAATWRAIGRGSHPLGWMGLALLAFSMTTLWPVYYIYYDVLLLLVSGALVETVEGGRLRMAIAAWALTLAGLGLMMVVTIRVVASPFPHVVSGEPVPEWPLRSGFDRPERDGTRRFSWIVGGEATVVIPRSSAAAADVVLSVLSPFDVEHPPQMVTAVLNGRLLGQASVAAGWGEVRFFAPRSSWWIGYNELQLILAASVIPREAGAGDDPRRLSLALSRVELVAQK